MRAIKVESTTIALVRYHIEKSILAITFRNGETYEYDGVIPTQVLNLLQADSVGKFFNEHIKDRYNTRKRAA